MLRSGCLVRRLCGHGEFKSLRLPPHYRQRWRVSLQIRQAKHGEILELTSFRHSTPADKRAPGFFRLGRRLEPVLAHS